MAMLKRLAQCVREFKLHVILTLVFIVAEVVIEVLIPFITASLINEISDGAEMSQILQKGLLLTVMAILSLCCGGIAGFTCAKASSGFAKNLRNDVFGKIQTFTFGNIDKFSSSSPRRNAMTTEKISIRGLRIAVRISIIKDICTLTTSVVRRVTSDEDENLSIFPNVKV